MRRRSAWPRRWTIARAVASSLSMRLWRFMGLPFGNQSLQFLDALEHIQQLDGPRGVIEDAQRGPDFSARLPTSQVPFQCLDGFARGLLQPADRGFHDAAPGLTVG